MDIEELDSPKENKIDGMVCPDCKVTFVQRPRFETHLKEDKCKVRRDKLSKLKKLEVMDEKKEKSTLIV